MGFTVRTSTIENSRRDRYSMRTARVSRSIEGIRRGNKNKREGSEKGSRHKREG